MKADSFTSEFDQTLAEAHSAGQVFEALQLLANRLVGVRLFTIMRVDMQHMLARRSYTSDERNYAVSGTKPVEMNSWFEVVHAQKRSFVANTPEEMAAVFPDHELIASLGCGSVVNLPVFLQGHLVATVNMLDKAHHYTPERVALLEQRLRLPATAAVLFEDLHQEQ